MEQTLHHQSERDRLSPVEACLQGKLPGSFLKFGSSEQNTEAENQTRLATNHKTEQNHQMVWVRSERICVD